MRPKTLTYKEKLLHIKNSPLQPAYVVTGAEEYLCETALKLITEKARLKSDEPPTVTKYYGDELESDQLSVDLLSYSLFSDSKIIIIKNIGQLRLGCWENIAQYLNDPFENTTLILEGELAVSKPKKKNDSKKEKSGNRAVINTVIEKAACYDFPALYDNQIVDWLRNYARKMGIVIDNDALLILKDANKPLLLNYVNEFEKIRLYSPKGGTINATEMLEILQQSRGADVYGFIDSVLKGETLNAVAQLRQIMLHNESTPYLIALLTGHLKNLMLVKIYNSRNLGRDKILKLIGIRPFLYNKLVSQAGNHSVGEIKTMLEAVLEADTHLKTGYQTDETVLTLLIQKIKSASQKNAA